MVANKTSICRITFSAIRIASKYCPLLTWRNISEIQAAHDSSNAERTLLSSKMIRPISEAVYHARPDSVNLLFHTELFVFEGLWCLSLLFLYIRRFFHFRSFDGGGTRRSPRYHFDIPKLDQRRRSQLVTIREGRTLLIM